VHDEGLDGGGNRQQSALLAARRAWSLDELGMVGARGVATTISMLARAPGEGDDPGQV